MTITEIFLVLAWGTVVGLDLVSFPQIMITRPMVAGTVTGAIVGDPASGLAVGAVLELFALEVLPVGAARYPDYGPATIAGVVVAAGTSGLFGVGYAVTVAMIVALLGEFSLDWVRRLNVASVRKRASRLDSGDASAVSVLQSIGLVRDLVRSLVLTGAGLALAWVARSTPPLSGVGAMLLDIVVIGAAVTAAAAGALRLSGSRSSLGWLAAGAAGGMLLVLSR